MKILVLNYEFPPLGGGASPVTYDICQELTKRGHKVDVVTMGYKGLKKYEKNNVRIYRVESLRRKVATSNFIEMFAYTITGYLKCKELVKKKNYDLVHVHFIIPTAIIAFILKKQFNLKYIITSHGSDVPGYNPDRFILLHKLIRPIWGVVIKNADYITTPSEFLKELILRNIEVDNIRVIPNGINYKKIKIAEKEKIILYAGRLFKRKGVQYLLKAVHLLPKDWKVMIVGEGDYKKELVTLSKKIDANIEFTGWVDKQHLYGIYKKSSIFVFPSSEESFGLVLAEAMMYSNAIITTKDTACEEVVKDSGILVRKKNYKAIRSAIDSLIRNPIRLKKYQNKAKRRAMDFSWDKIINQYVSLYDKTT
ncbi:glycosyltransferase family 4 protein [Candidatus Woesearchaeota archaeon]|nr:glycosyltransferase family 4 protein [Candidatus Woesearchaeota archaeon]